LNYTATAAYCEFVSLNCYITGMTNEQHNKFIGIAFLVHGIVYLLASIAIIAIFILVFALSSRAPEDDGPNQIVFVFFAIAVFVQLFIFVAPSFVAAYGLLNRKSWARIAAIIAGVVSAMNVPIGTAACIYALWFFFGENWKTVYPEAGGLPRRELQSGYESTRSAKDEFNFENAPTTPPDWR